MTIREKFEVLAPEIIDNCRLNGGMVGVDPGVVRFIQSLDKVPEIHRRYPSVTRCCRELQKLYPELFTSFRYAQEVVYASIQYFHINNSVSNAAWDMFYADKQEEIAQMAVMSEKFDQASLCIERARAYRTNKDESAIPREMMRPTTTVVDPSVPSTYLGFEAGKEPSLKEMFKPKLQRYREVCDSIDKMEIPEADKKRVKDEARLNLNIPEDVDYEEIE